MSNKPDWLGMTEEQMMQGDWLSVHRTLLQARQELESSHRCSWMDGAIDLARDRSRGAPSSLRWTVMPIDLLNAVQTLGNAADFPHTGHYVEIHISLKKGQYQMLFEALVNWLHRGLDPMHRILHDLASLKQIKEHAELLPFDDRRYFLDGQNYEERRKKAWQEAKQWCGL